MSKYSVSLNSYFYFVLLNFFTLSFLLEPYSCKLKNSVELDFDSSLTSMVSPIMAATILQLQVELEAYLITMPMEFIKEVIEDKLAVLKIELQRHCFTFNPS